MNQEIKTKWLEALRSGKYSRGRGLLKNEVLEGQIKHCCLGVLCELHSEMTGEGKWDNLRIESTHTYIVGEKSSTKVLPWRVVKWAGLNDEAGTIKVDEEDKDKLVSCDLVSLVASNSPFITEVNDRSKRDDFEDVIPLIEKYL